MTHQLAQRLNMVRVLGGEEGLGGEGHLFHPVHQATHVLGVIDKVGLFVDKKKKF